MQCKSCGFLVPQNLKFAIMRNFCPQCGEKLFTESEMNHISRIQSKVLQQDFTSGMEEQSVYDIALFIYNEVTSGYGRIILDEELQKMLKASKDKSDSEDVEFKETDVKENLEKVKAQIREEEAARVALESRQPIPPPGHGEDVEDKVKRLKEAYKRSPIKMKNPKVNRIDS